MAAAAPSDHRLAERRSLAYHDAIASRLDAEPALLARARARVHGWLGSGEVPAAYAQSWADILARPSAELQRLLRDDSERMAALRQVTPFAGALSARERWRLWRAVRSTP